MRQFFSYGPVDAEQHFCVPRQALIDQCAEQLIGHPAKGGRYFTIWAPRQAGKTWIMRQVAQKIQAQYGDRFMIGDLSMQGMILEDDDPPEKFLEYIPRQFSEEFKVNIAALNNWDAWTGLFSKTSGVFERPVILFIDEFDSLPRPLIDRLVTLFRDVYLNRERYWLHGLALIGVRAVLGVESKRGSPFNVQNALRIPNLTWEEVQELYRQYQDESGQTIQPDVVAAVYKATNGQPGLVSWFGELLTEKYNPGRNAIIDAKTFEYVYARACNVEFNNTVLNMIKKARTEYQRQVVELFTRSDVRFSIDADWCNYLYLHGLIDETTVTTASGTIESICRFSSPFIQHRLYSALTYDVCEDAPGVLALEPLDDLRDVFAGETLDLPALLTRYTGYLTRLKAKGINPWKEQPRRATDLHLTEAVGHFHLYAWLHQAIGRRCVVSPEFPTGNGKADMHIKCGDKRGIIEIKSFVDAYQAKLDQQQAARYAKNIGLASVTLVTFVPIEDATVLAKLSGEHCIDGVAVSVVAIGWV